MTDPTTQADYWRNVLLPAFQWVEQNIATKADTGSLDRLIARSLARWAE